MPSTFKPRGYRGSWLADWQGERLACVHNHWHRGEWYNDPYAKLDPHGKWASFISAISSKRKVIETIDDVPEDEHFGIWKRMGYIGLWEVDNIETIPNRDVPGTHHLRFRFAKRLI